MALSDTIETAEKRINETFEPMVARINETVEPVRETLKSVADGAEEQVGRGSDALLEGFDITRSRVFEDLYRARDYTTDATNRLTSALPSVDLPLVDRLPSADDLANRWFETAEQLLAYQKSFTMDMIAALRGKDPKKVKAGKAAAKKSAASTKAA